jgi:hypothetical protein
MLNVPVWLMKSSDTWTIQVPLLLAEHSRSPGVAHLLTPPESKTSVNGVMLPDTVRTLNRTMSPATTGKVKQAASDGFEIVPVNAPAPYEIEVVDEHVSSFADAGRDVTTSPVTTTVPQRTAPDAKSAHHRLAPARPILRTIFSVA